MTLNYMLGRLTSWYRTLSRRIFVKLILLIVIPNLLLLAIINQLMNKQIKQKTEEMDNTLYVLEHAASREIRAIFSDVTTLTNQILIEPDVQHILKTGADGGSGPASGSPTDERLALRDKYIRQDTMRSILSRYRLVWNNIFSIAVIDRRGEIYLNTSENYQFDHNDMGRSLLLAEVASPDQSGLAWSTNDALTKNADMITIARKIYGVDQPRQVIGYVVVNLSLEAVRSSFETYNYYDQMIFGLVNQAENTWMIYDKKKMTGGHGRLFSDRMAALNGHLTQPEFRGRSWRTVVMQMEKRDYLFVGLDAEYISETSSRFRRELYYGYVFFLFLSVFISILGTKVLSARLGKLNQAMRKFGQERWGTRIELKGNDEIRIIGDTFNSMASHIEGLLVSLKEEQRLKRIFELRVLEYQINPHFLYNTLDSIYWLAQENRQSKISEMVSGLSKLFRIILSKGKEVISLHEEFEMIRIYLSIQKIRFEERFEFTLNLEPDIAEYPIGKLVLQPLVENAIVHGIRRLRAKGQISVTGGKMHDEIVLEIRDNGIGMKPEQLAKQLRLLDADVLENASVSSSGYGMKNVDSRLKMLFGGEYKMTLHSSASGRTGTTIRIHIKETAMLKMKFAL
ncbi:sensor histidine kinase [Paenibacillus hamazuiensis]|uniref:sensor histidine kinase n=1 Tax=Paenibacillus hamazuiensis TaxID=2936508 RepID=UPI00200E7A22|nr:histidine kinase [Paenibacillus hamazuiensis]